MKISKIEVIPLTILRSKPLATSRGVWGSDFADVRNTTDLTVGDI